MMMRSGGDVRTTFTERRSTKKERLALSCTI
jgi:hypothetical protein